MLGSSRGGFDLEKILQFLETNRINQVPRGAIAALRMPRGTRGSRLLALALAGSSIPSAPRLSSTLGGPQLAPGHSPAAARATAAAQKSGSHARLGGCHRKPQISAIRNRPD